MVEYTGGMRLAILVVLIAWDIYMRGGQRKTEHETRPDKITPP